MATLLAISALVLTVIQGYVLIRVLGPLGGISNLLMVPSVRPAGRGVAVVGRRARRIRCSPCGPGSTRATRLTPGPNTVIVLADTRSVACRRVMRLVGSLSKTRRCPVSWTWCVAGAAPAVTRLAGETRPVGTVLRVSPRIAVRALASGVPVAIYVGPDGRVRHIEALANWQSLMSFVSACPNDEFRTWLRKAHREAQALPPAGPVERTASTAPASAARDGGR